MYCATTPLPRTIFTCLGIDCTFKQLDLTTWQITRSSVITKSSLSYLNKKVNKTNKRVTCN